VYCPGCIQNIATHSPDLIPKCAYCRFYVVVPADQPEIPWYTPDLGVPGFEEPARDAPRFNLGPGVDNPVAEATLETYLYPILDHNGQLMRHITVPRGLIDELKIYFEGLEQTTADFALLRKKTKMLLTNLAAPPSRILDLLVHVPIIVFHDYHRRDQVTTTVAESIKRRVVPRPASPIMCIFGLFLATFLCWLLAPRIVQPCESLVDQAMLQVKLILLGRPFYNEVCEEPAYFQLVSLDQVFSYIQLDCRGYIGLIHRLFTYAPFAIYGCVSYITVTATALYTTMMCFLLIVFIYKYREVRCLHGLFEECFRMVMMYSMYRLYPLNSCLILTSAFVSIIFGVFEMLLTYSPLALFGHLLLGVASLVHPCLAIFVHMMLNSRLTKPFSLVYHLTNCTLEPPTSIRRFASATWSIPIIDPLITRASQYFYGIGHSIYRPVAYAPNWNNERIAIEHRVLKNTPPTVQLDKTVFHVFRKWVLCNRAILMPFKYVKSVSFETYIKYSNASGSVKRVLIKTKKELDSLGIDEDTYLTRAQVRKWTTRKSFVKVENNLYRTLDVETNKAPRLIQGAPPEFIVLVGPWIMALQKKFKKKWSTDFFICYTSGVSSLDSGNYITSQPDWTILEDDVSAWDASIHEEMCTLEVRLSGLFGAPRAVFQLMSGNINTRGVTSKGHFYNRKGMRKSGDPYTSLYNTMWNALIHTYIYCVATNKTVEECQRSIKMLVQGDDSLIVHEKACIIPWKESMAAFGFDAEATTRSFFHECEFCSNLLYEVAEGWVFGPKPGRIFAKLAYYVNPPKNVSRESLVRGTAIGLYSSCGHIPYIRCYLDRLMELTAGSVAHHVLDGDWRMKYQKCTPVHLTMFTIYERYMMANVEERMFKAGLQCAQLGVDFDNSLFHWMIDREQPTKLHW